VAPAYDGDGQVRKGASVADITGLLDIGGWPAGMRVTVRKGRPHPGAQLRWPTRVYPPSSDCAVLVSTEHPAIRCRVHHRCTRRRHQTSDRRHADVAQACSSGGAPPPWCGRRRDSRPSRPWNPAHPARQLGCCVKRCSAGNVRGPSGPAGLACLSYQPMFGVFPRGSQPDQEPTR
jgi:hypothetical protein